MASRSSSSHLLLSLLWQSRRLWTDPTRSGRVPIILSFDSRVCIPESCCSAARETDLERTPAVTSRSTSSCRTSHSLRYSYAVLCPSYILLISSRPALNAEQGTWAHETSRDRLTTYSHQLLTLRYGFAASQTTAMK